MRWKLTLAFGLSAVVFLPGQVSAVAVPIVNPGFEDPDVATTNNGPITGWTISGTGGAGVWDINNFPAGFWSVPAPEGDQIAFVSNATGPATVTPQGSPATISQVLGTPLQHDLAYTLTGQVGHPTGFGTNPDPDTLYTVELFAGGNLLATSGLVTGPEGTFLPFLVTFDSTGSPFVGQLLEIRLSSNQAQTGFDDITLTAVPEPATLALMALGVMGVLFCLRRRAGEAVVGA